jgi:hypothetical protein
MFSLHLARLRLCSAVALAPQPFSICVFFSKLLGILIYEKHARKPFRMRSFKTQHLKPFRMSSYRKTGVGAGPDITVRQKEGAMNRAPTGERGNPERGFSACARFACGSPSGMILC